MTYRQFEHLGPEQDSFYRDLCHVVERHLGKTGDEAAFFAERLVSHGILNGYAYDVIDGPKDLEALQRVDRALIELSRACSDVAMTGATALRVQAALMFGPHLENPNRDKEASLTYIEAHGKPNAVAFSKVTDETAVFREAIAKVIQGIKSDPRAKRSLRVRIHNQNITTAANAHADKKTLGHLS